MESSNKRIAKNTVFLYLRMILVMGVTLFTSRIVLQALGVEDYGLYNAVGSIVVMFAIINNMLSSGTSRFLTFELGRGDKEKLKKTFGASFAMHSAMAILILLLAETVGLWFLNEKMVIPADRYVAANWLYQFSIVTCMLSLTQIPYNATIIAHERMGVYAWVGVVEVTYKLAIVYFLLYAPVPDKLILYGALYMLWNVGVQVFYRFYCHKNFEEASITIVKDKSLYKKMLSFSLWDTIGAFCATGNSQGANILINLFFGVTVNAARGVSYQVENAVTQFSNNFMTAVKPQITKLFAQERYEEFFKLIFDSAKFSYFLLFIIELPIFLEIDYILSIWLVEVPPYTAMFIRYISITRLIRALNTPVMYGVHATGNIKWMNLLSGGQSVLLTLPVTYILYKMGLPPQSLFWVIILTCFLGNFFEDICLKKNLDFSILKFSKEVYLKSAMLSLLASIPAVGIVLLLDPSFLRLIITTIVSVASVIIVVFYLGISQEMREKVIYVVKGKIGNKNNVRQ